MVAHKNIALCHTAGESHTAGENAPRAAESAIDRRGVQGEESLASRKNSVLISRNLLIGTKRTSARLEPDMWAALFEIARREGLSVHEVATMIDKTKPEFCSLTAALRVAVTAYFRAAATEEGHARAGHGYGTIAYPPPAASSRHISLKNGTNGIPWR